MADPSRRAIALALGAPLAAIAAGAIGAGIASVVAPRSLDVRLVSLVLPAALALLLARLIESPPRRRWIWGLLAASTLGAAIAPRSSIAVSWLTLATLALALLAFIRTARALSAGPRSRFARYGIATLSLLIFAQLWLGAFVVLVNTQLIVAPARLAHLSPTRGPAERTLLLTTSDGLALGATYTPGQPGAPGIVLAHGVADGRTRLAPWSERLAERGYHALRLDLRAHGTSEGAVCTYGQREREDIVAAVRALRRLPAVGPDIAVVGASMGGAAVLAASPDLPHLGVRGAILLAPASDFRPLVAARVAWLGPLAPAVLSVSAVIARAVGQGPMTGWVPREGLSESAELPLLILHGDADESIPLSMSHALVREHGPSTLHVLEGVAHHHLPQRALEGEASWAAVESFLARVLAE